VFGQSAGKAVPAGLGPALVSVERAGMQNRVAPARSYLPSSRALRTDDVRRGRKTERLRQRQELRDAMVAGLGRHSDVIGMPLPPGPGLAGGRHQTNPAPTGDQRKNGRPVAGLGRDSQIVATPQGERLAGTALLRDRKHIVDVGITPEDALAAAK